MEISGIQAYAYNPDVPGPTPQLLTNVPATLDATLGRSTAVSGVTITDPAAGASDTISVTVSDQSLGILSVTAEDGADVTINNGWEVQLSGSLSAVNATLQTLAYKNVPTGSTVPTTDTLTVSATDSSGNMDSSRTSVILNASLPAPQFITFGSAPVREMASGNDVFVFTAGQIPDPALNDGQADHIINFHTAAQSAGGTSDFIALYGFAPTATLVFSHDADVNGVPDAAMQYLSGRQPHRELADLPRANGQPVGGPSHQLPITASIRRDRAAASAVTPALPCLYRDDPEVRRERRAGVGCARPTRRSAHREVRNDVERLVTILRSWLAEHQSSIDVETDPFRAPIHAEQMVVRGEIDGFRSKPYPGALCQPAGMHGRENPGRLLAQHFHHIDFRRP